MATGECITHQLGPGLAAAGVRVLMRRKRDRRGGLVGWRRLAAWLHHGGCMGASLAGGAPLLALVHGEHSSPTPALPGSEKRSFSLLPRRAGVPPATHPVAPGWSPMGCVPSHTLPSPSWWSGKALPQFPLTGLTGAAPSMEEYVLPAAGTPLSPALLEEGQF